MVQRDYISSDRIVTREGRVINLASNEKADIKALANFVARRQREAELEKVKRQSSRR